MNETTGNTMDMIHEEVFDIEKKTIKYLSSIVLTIFSLVGTFGNIVTIISLLRMKLENCIFTKFIISLSISNFLMCAVCLPLLALYSINDGWIYGETGCRLFILTIFANAGVSLFIMAIISINRCILIGYKKYYNKIYTKNVVIFFHIFSWFVPFLLSSFVAFNILGGLEYDETAKICVICEKNKSCDALNILFITVITTLFIFIINYSIIFCSVKKSSKLKRRQSLRSYRNNKNEWKFAKMMLIIFITFIVCYIPHAIASMLATLHNSKVPNKITELLIYLSSVINPIIYATFDKQYRQAFKDLLLCRKSSGYKGPSSTHENSGSQEQNDTNM